MKQQRNVLGRGLSALISASPIPINRPSSAELPASENLQSQNSNVNYVPQFQQAGNLAVAPVIEEQMEPTSDSNSPQVRFIEISSILNNPAQPRQEFNQQELTELADSIKTLGVLQPVLVRPSTRGENKFEIVAGERRWRAAKLAGLNQVPALVHELTDKEALEIALVENIQRSNLNPVEEAQAYKRLMEDFGLSQQDVADRVGKDRASVANYLRLLKLPIQVTELLKAGSISMGHAKAILSIKDPSAQISLAKKVISDNLSVRALENIVARVTVLDAGHTGTRNGQMLDQKTSTEINAFPEIVDRMRNVLGTKVSVKHHNSGRGRIEIEYFSEQELDRVVEHICR